MNIQKLRQDYDSMRNEYQICKQKLDSKCEALLILTRDLDRSRQERDQFKLMAEQVQQRYQALKRQLAGVGPRANSFEASEYSGMKQQNLAQLLCEMRECNKTLQFETEDLRQKLKDAQGDIKLLREQIARQRVGATDEGISTRHFPAHEREDLVKKLEAAKEQVAQMERDLQQVLDEKEEQETERDVYKSKYERLNQELSYILKGDENRIVDIDALVMENKYLQQRIDQMEEEKCMAMATVTKYKSLLERKKNKGILKLGQSRAGGVVIVQRQVKELLHNQNTGPPTQQMLSDLQSLATALLETVNDKNLALQHQRKTNKILGDRVSELEKKLKTLEVSGLWSTAEKPATLDRLKIECEEIKSLIPRQLSECSDAPSNEEQIEMKTHESPPSDCTVNGASNHITPANGQLSLEDLDFLPTKDTSQISDSGDHQSAGTMENLTNVNNTQSDSDVSAELSLPEDNVELNSSNLNHKTTESPDLSDSEKEENFEDCEELEKTANELSTLLEEMTLKVTGCNVTDCLSDTEVTEDKYEEEVKVTEDEDCNTDAIVSRSESPSDSAPLLKETENHLGLLEESAEA